MYYIINGQKIGYYYTAEYDNYIAIYILQIDGQYRGQGYGTKMLESILYQYDHLNKPFKATILGGYNNYASIRIFEKCGFQFYEEDDQVYAEKN